MEIDKIRAPKVIILLLETAVEAAVCEEAFFGGAIVVGETI